MRGIAATGYPKIELTRFIPTLTHAGRGWIPHGLPAPADTSTVKLLESEPLKVVATARRLGMRLVVAPWLKLEERLSDLHDWRRFGERLEGIDARLRGEGLTLRGTITSWSSSACRTASFQSRSFFTARRTI